MKPQRLTLREIQEDLDLKLFDLDRKQKEKSFEITDIGDFLPVGLLINHKSGKNVYMNKISEEVLNYTLDEIEELGEKYAHAIVYDMEEFARINLMIDSFYQRNDDTEILSFFQRLRPQGCRDFKWMYVTSKLFVRDSQTQPHERLLVACPVNLMGDMESKINRVLNENYYMKRNFRNFARLTKREKEVLALVAQGLSNPEISERLFISRFTVEQHRKNIRSKIDFKNYAEMIKFAETFDLLP